MTVTLHPFRWSPFATLNALVAEPPRSGGKCCDITSTCKFIRASFLPFSPSVFLLEAWFAQALSKLHLQNVGIENILGDDALFMLSGILRLLSELQP